MEVEEDEFELFDGERVLVKDTQCFRRYCPPNVERTPSNYKQLKQSITITNYRALFKGQTHPDITMQLNFVYVKLILNPKKNLFLLSFELKKSYGSKHEQTRVSLKFSTPQVAKDIMDIANKQCLAPQNGNHLLLKMQELVNDSVRYNIYMSLVHEKKLLTVDEFWKNDELLQMNYRNLREDYDKKLQQKKIQTVMNRPKPVNNQSLTEYQPEFLRKQIQSMNLTPKPEDINNATRDMLFREIQDMYLNNSKFYQKFTQQEIPADVNEGVRIVVEEQKEMKVQEKPQIQYAMGAPMVIPETQMKFEVKGESMLNFLNRPKVKKGEPGVINQKKEITRKVVEYVKLFYSCMANNSKEIASFQKEIRVLQKQIKDMPGSEDLLKFLQKSIQNYMKHRKQNPHS